LLSPLPLADSRDLNPGEHELAIKPQRAEDEHLLVSVSDTGVGLPAQQADHMFNAFFITKLHGSGMGLRISRSIIESHGLRVILHATPDFTSCCQ
jgi:signal transduction histidine kinase